jgi:hypothetical protein
MPNLIHLAAEPAAEIFDRYLEQLNSGDLDSRLILTSHSIARAKTRIELVQVNVPDHDHFAGVSQGSEIYHWARWRECLKTRGLRRSPRAHPARR